MVSTNLQPTKTLTPNVPAHVMAPANSLSLCSSQAGRPGRQLLPMPSRASLTLNVPLSRAQLSQELAQDTGLADIRQLTGEQSGRSLSQAATSSCLPHLACVSRLHPAPEAQGPFASQGAQHPNVLRSTQMHDSPHLPSATTNHSPRPGLLVISNL